MAQAKFICQCLRFGVSVLNIPRHLSQRGANPMQSSFITKEQTRLFSIEASQLGIKADVSSENSESKKRSDESNFRTRFHERVNKATDLEELLELVDSGKKITVTNAAAILKKVTILGKQSSTINIETLSSDNRIESLSLVIHKQVLNTPPGVVIGGLGNLLELHLEDTYIIESLEQHITWLLPKMSVGQLVHVIQVHHNHQETELRKKVYNEAKTLVEKRWVEIANGGDVVSLMYLFGLENETFMSKLQEKGLDLAEKMTAKELYHVVYILSKIGDRNAPLLRALVYHLNRQKLTLNPIQVMNLAFACSRLNIFDSTLLEKITMSMLYWVPRLDSTQGNIVASYLHSIGLLRWHHTDLLDLFADFLNSHSDDIKAVSYITLLLTCASVNYHPPNVEDKFASMLTKLDRGENPRLWLDAIWSLGVLGLAKPEHLESILQQEFFSVLTEGDNILAQKSIPKLLNINIMAQKDYPDYKGPFLPEELVSKWAIQLSSRSSKGAVGSVVKVIDSFAPAPKFFTPDVTTVAGHVIDIEMLVTNDGQPQSLLDGKADQFQRVAIRVHDFSDLTLHTVKSTGLTSLATKQLSQLGYNVVEVPHTEFAEKATIVEKVQYIQMKIKSAVEKKA